MYTFCFSSLWTLLWSATIYR